MIESLLADPSVTFVIGYLAQLPSLIMQGDVSALVLGLILFYAFVVVFRSISGFMLFVLKKTIVLIIVGYAFYMVGIEMLARMAGADSVFIFLGLVGISLGFFGTLFAIFGLFKTGAQSRQLRGVPGTVPYRTVPARAAAQMTEDKGYYLGPAARQAQEQKAAPATEKKKGELEKILSGESSLTTILTYILIAEFGVFSSITLSAPTVEAGIVLALFFLLAVGIYTIKTYDDAKEGALFLGIALVVAVTLSFVLGIFWAQHPWSELLSAAYFKSDALVATITGVALSIFMGKSGN